MTEHFDAPSRDHIFWYYTRSVDTVIWSVGYLSRDEAIAAARAEEMDNPGPLFVIKAYNPPLRLADYLPVDTILDLAEDAVVESGRVYTQIDKGPYFFVSTQQKQDLSERLCRACDEWQGAQGLVFRVGSFKDLSEPEAIHSADPETIP
jgi:hypothetical protein